MKKHSLLAIMLVLAITAGLFNFTQVTAASVDTAAQSLLNEYYNGGNYTKHTEIYYVGEAGGAYAATCFHAGVDKLIRETEYTSGKLYMSNAEGTINSGYKDVDGAMAHFSKVGAQEVIDYTVANTSVEQFYYTLFDLKGISGWTRSGDKYSLALNAENATPWVHFIAPLWISNHISISRVTVYESNGLVLELYGTIAGVVEAETLFAKATVNYRIQAIQNFTDASLNKTDGFFSWSGTFRPSSSIAISGVSVKGYLYITTEEYIVFNGTKDGNLRILCAANSDGEYIVIEGETYTIPREGCTIDAKLNADGEVRIQPSDKGLFICEIAYTAIK